MKLDSIVLIDRSTGKALKRDFAFDQPISERFTDKIEEVKIFNSYEEAESIRRSVRLSGYTWLSNTSRDTLSNFKALKEQAA